MSSPTEELQALAQRLHRARRVLVVTGAGVSAESGLPTYRGVGGLYEHASPPEGIPIEEILSGPMFASRPRLTWKYIAQIERACRNAEPNRAHLTLAQMEPHFERFCVITQNVDNLHRQAGSTDLIDIHGNFHQLYCPSCPYRNELQSYEALSDAPLCPRCGTIIRPDIVLFQEALPVNKMQRMKKLLQSRLDLVFSIGTSSAFAYIQAPILRAKKAGVFTIEINPERTVISRQVDLRLKMSAGEALKKLWSLYLEQSA